MGKVNIIRSIYRLCGTHVIAICILPLDAQGRLENENGDSVIPSLLDR